MKNRYLYVFTFFWFLLTLNSAFSAVEVFNKYDTVMSINKNNTFDVNKTMVLRNVHEVGIVPGEIEIKVPKDGGSSDISISNLGVYDRYGKEIKHKIVETNDYYYVIMNIFTPVLPGFDYNINLFYTISFDSSGLLFKNLQVPLRDDVSVPIKSGNFKIVLPEGYSFTYVENGDNATSLSKTVVSFEINDASAKTLSFEYSRIPLNLGGMKGSLVFWILINLVLFIILGLEIKKEIKKRREN